MLPILRRVGFRHLTARPLRSALVVLAVALGVSMLTAVQLINASTRQAFRAAVDEVAGRAALQVTGPESGFPEELREIIQGVPGVTAAVPLVLGTAFVPESGEAIHVFGIDLVDEGSVRTYRSRGGAIDDPLVFLNQPDSVIVGAELADRLVLDLEGPIRMLTPRGLQRFTVRGLLASEGAVRVFGGNFAAMDLYAAQIAFAREGRVDQIDIVVDAGASIDAVRERVAAVLSAGIEIERPWTRGAAVDRMLASFHTLFSGFASLGLIVAAFVVYNTVTMAVSQRQRELGVLRQIGARRREMLLAVSLEGGLLALPGSLLGLGFGIVIADVLKQPISQSLATAVAANLQVGDLALPAATLGGMVLFGVGIAVVAAFVPAIRAARTSPITAAQGSFDVTRRGPSRRGVLLGTALVLLLPLSLIVLMLTPTSQEIVSAALAIGNLSFFVGFAVLGPSLVLILGRFLQPVLPRLFGVGARVAWDSFGRAPWRTAATLTTLLVALSFMVIVATLARSLERSMISWLDQVYPAVDLLVRSAHMVGGWRPASFSDDIVRQIAESPGVEHALGKQLVPYTGPDGRRILLQAFDFVPDCTRCGFHAVRMPFIEGDAADARRRVPAGEAVLVSDSLVAHTGIRVGDTLVLNTARRQLELPVAGVVAEYSSNEGMVILARSLYVEEWNDPTVNFVNVVTKPGSDVHAVRADLARRFGISHELTVLTTSAAQEELSELIIGSFRFLYGLEVIALGVALLGVVQMLLVGTLERIRDIAVLRSIGMTRRQLVLSVIIESGAIGVVGAILGLGAGTVLAFAWVTIYVYKLLGWTLSFHFPWSLVIQAGVSAVLTGVVAGLYPAWRASRVPLTEAARYE